MPLPYDVDDVYLQANLDELDKRTGQSIGSINEPAWDSGWFAAEANTNHFVTITHNLHLDLMTRPPQMDCWFTEAVTDPKLTAPVNVYPKSLRGMEVDDAATGGQGYSNPGTIQLQTDVLVLYFYAAMPLFSVFDGTWHTWQTGWLRYRMWN